MHWLLESMRCPKTKIRKFYKFTGLQNRETPKISVSRTQQLIRSQTNMQVSHWRLMRELSWVMSKSHTRRKSQHELKWNTAQQVARIKYIWRASRQPQLEAACVLRLQEEEEWSWTSIPSPGFAFKSHSGWISPISEVTGTSPELLPRLSPSSHQPFLLAYW